MPPDQEKTMSFFIERINETDGVTRTRLPGDYGDEQAAKKAVETVLTGYASHGRKYEQGYWWALDHNGTKFKFVISGG
jgi:hypothetical protein